MISDSSRFALKRSEIFAVPYNLFSFARHAVAMASLFLISTSDVGHNPFIQCEANVLKVVNHDYAAYISSVLLLVPILFSTPKVIRLVR